MVGIERRIGRIIDLGTLNRLWSYSELGSHRVKDFWRINVRVLSRGVT